MLTLTAPIKLIVADDHCMIREGFKQLFAQQNDIELIALASNGREVVELTEQHHPEVVLVDVEMPIMDAKEACIYIKDKFPNVGVIAFSMHDSEDLIADMRNAGARGYLLKETDGAEISRAVRAVSEGGEYYCSRSRKKLNRLLNNRNDNKHSDERKKEFDIMEIEIIKLICKEQTSKEIASVLGIKTRAVEHHKRKIEGKMGVQSGIGIAVYAIRNWLLY